MKKYSSSKIYYKHFIKFVSIFLIFILFLYLLYKNFTINDAGFLTQNNNSFISIEKNIEDEYVYSSLYNFKKNIYQFNLMNDCNDGFRIEKFNKGVLLYDCEGNLYKINLNQQTDIPDIKIIPQLKINLKNDELRKYAAKNNYISENAKILFPLGVKSIKHYDQNKYFVSYTQWNESQSCIYFILAKFTFDENILNNQLHTVFKTDDCIRLKSSKGREFSGAQSGGAIEFLDKDNILLSIGDFEYDGYHTSENLPQDPKSDFGKVLKINLHTGKKKIYSMGVRNPQGLLNKNGLIFATDHGPKGGDEINIIKENYNYGWPYENYGLNYNGDKYPQSISFGKHDKFEQPIFSFIPDIGVSSIINIDKFDDKINGDFLIASLVNGIYRARLGRENNIVYTEFIPVGDRIRNIVQINGGDILLLTKHSKKLIMLR